MSRVVTEALKQVENTKFIFNDRGGFEVRDAFIFWTNFRGEANPFGNATRNFNLAITPDMGKELITRGWRVKERDLNDEDGNKVDTLYFINVKVNMNSKNPPIVSLYSEFKGKRTKRALDINTIGELDRIDIQTSDMVINAYESPNFPGKITGYLQKINAIQEPDIEFGGKYDDWLEEEADCLADGTCSLMDEM